MGGTKREKGQKIDNGDGEKVNVNADATLLIMRDKKENKTERWRMLYV